MCWVAEKIFILMIACANDVSSGTPCVFHPSSVLKTLRRNSPLLSHLNVASFISSFSSRLFLLTLANSPSDSPAAVSALVVAKNPARNCPAMLPAQSGVPAGTPGSVPVLGSLVPPSTSSIGSGFFASP